MTHTHWDHTGTNTEFPDTVDFVVHENTLAQLSRATCEPVTNCDAFKGENSSYLPRITYSQRTSLFTGDDQIDLYYFGRGHTDGDTFVYFPESDVLHLGDVFRTTSYPIIDVYNGGTLAGTIEALELAVEMTDCAGGRAVRNTLREIYNNDGFEVFGHGCDEAMWAAVGGAARCAIGVVPQELTIDPFFTPREMLELQAGLYGLRSAGLMGDERGRNVLDGGAHYYDVYKTRDGKYIALAPIEPRFYATLLEQLGVDAEALPQSTTREDWPALKLQLASLIETRTRDEWAELLEGTDACFAPVLSMAEAPHHAHNRARETFVERDGGWQPNASPRFSRTATEIKSAPAAPGEHSHQTLVDWGIDAGTVHALIERGVVAQRGA